MICNCVNIYPDEDLKKWSVCQSFDILENYYTKKEVDEKIDNIDVGSGITPSEVQVLIDDSLIDYFTKLETEEKLSTKLDASAYTPTDLSGYATQEWVNNQGYLTQHQPLKTINNQSLIGEGNIDISGGSADLSNYYNKTEVDDKLDLKANASDALSNVQVSPNGSGNYTWLNTYKNGTVGTTGYFGKINGTPIASRFTHEVKNMSLVETSAITSSLTSASTDEQVPSAKATYDALNLKANTSDLRALNTTVGQLSTTVENKADKSEIPSLNGYATEQWVEDKNYLTTHQPLKTINNQSLIGEGNITISGETPDLTNYYNKTEVNDLLRGKADVGDVDALETAVGQLFDTVENVYTKTEVNNLVNNKFWCGTQSQYDALTNKENDVLYLIY